MKDPGELMSQRNTGQDILDAAQALIQARGYNGFSFSDIARQLGIRAASIHYHFPGKADLGRALLVQHRQSLQRTLAKIDAQARAPAQKLAGYVQLFRNAPGDGSRICLCGALSAEYNTLPESMRAELQSVLADGEAWLSGVLARGQAQQAFEFEGAPSLVARALTSALQGAVLAARVFGDRQTVAPVGEWLLDTLKASEAGPRAGPGATSRPATPEGAADHDRPPPHAPARAGRSL